MAKTNLIQQQKEQWRHQEVLDVQRRLAYLENEQLEINKRREKRESVVSYGSLVIAALSLLVALVALCRPIQIDHNYTIAVPDFPTLEHSVRCDQQGQKDNNGDHGIVDGP